MKNKSNKYYVGDLASHFGVSSDTIRLYDKMGILHPAEVSESGYRVYNREDFICMDYVMRLRKLNMPLEEIKELVNSSDIERAEAVMQVQSRVLEEKIAELRSMQLMVTDYRKSFSNVIQHMGKIEEEVSPLMIMKEVTDSVADVMMKFNDLTQDYVPKFTFTTTKEKYANPSAWEDIINPDTRQNFYDYAITLIDDEGFSERMNLEKMGFTVLKPHKSIHAILKAYTNRDYSEFYRCRDYLIENGYELAGNPIFRLVSVRSYDVSYYDFWAPVV